MQSSPYYLKQVFLLLVFVLAYGSTLNDLMSRWLQFDSAQSHGLIIVALFLMMMHKRLPYAIPLMNHRTSGILLIVCSSFLWFIAILVNVNIVEQLSVIFILGSILYSLYGFKRNLFVLTPVLFLFFSIPIWDYLTSTLVQLSSDVVSYLVRQSDVMAYIEGNSIYFATGTIQIVDGCSGLRYLTISMVLACYLLMDSQATLKQRLSLLVVAIILGLSTNWLRIYIIVMLGYLTDMQSSLVTEGHETFGWILFCIVASPLIFYSNRLKPSPYSRRPDWNPLQPTNKVTAITTICLLIAPLLYVSPLMRPAVPTMTTQLPVTTQAQDISELAYIVDPVPKSFTRVIENVDDYAININRLLNWQTFKGDVLVPYIYRTDDHENWIIEHSDSIVISDTRIAVEILRQKFYGIKKVRLSWYQVGNQTTDSYSKAKLYQFYAILSLNNYFSYNQYSIHCDTENCAVEQAFLTNYLSSELGQ